MPDVSARGAGLPASPIRKLSPFADEAKRKGIKVYHLNIGQPDLPTPEKAMNAIRNIDSKTLAYSPSQGILPLREEFVKYYRKFGIDLTPDEIIVTSGGSEALLATFLTCFDPGDEVIITEPGYANYIGFAKATGLIIKPVTSRIEGKFALPSAEDLRKAITPKTKAILICNPNNPTGYLYSPDELFQLKELVQENNLFLIADEVYREFVYTSEPYVSALSLFGIEDNVIVVDSVSKRYSECGIRVGMVVRTIAFAPLRDAVAVSVSGLFFTVLTAMTSFVITLVFLRNDLSADVFGTYLYSDFLCAMENAARYFLCVVAAWAVRLFYSSRGASPSFEKPYIVPKGAVGFPLAVSLAVWLAVTVCGVAFSSVTENAVGTLVYELVVCVCGYFIAVLGALFISK